MNEIDRNHRIYKMTFASVYPLYVQKVTRKDRLETELIQVIKWLTSYNEAQIFDQIDKAVTFEDFFDQAPQLNPNMHLITGTICGVKIAEIQDPLMLKIRYLDKLVDELAKGKTLEKILRK